MLTITINDILQGDWNTLDPTNEPLCIYVIREGDTIFYVGRSYDPLNRLRAHLGKPLHSDGTFYPFYRQWHEKSYAWQIDLYSLAECEKTVMEYRPISLERYRDAHWHDDMVIRAESAMILRWKPCLNDKNNPNASHLPSKYNPSLDLPCAFTTPILEKEEQKNVNALRRL